MQTNTTPSKKKRLLALAGIIAVPLVLIIVVLFQMLTPKKKPATVQPAGSGFNAALPAPNLPKQEMNKLELYAQAVEDSIKHNADRASDPYNKMSRTDSTQKSISKPGHPAAQGIVTSPFSDDNEKKVNDRMQKLYGLMNTGTPPASSKAATVSLADPEPTAATAQIARLQKMMQDNQQPDTTPNPQLTQVKQILDEIKDIQHPGNKQADLATSENAAPPLRVSTVPNSWEDPADRTSEEMSNNGFFGLSEQPDSSYAADHPVIEAVVHGDQTIQTGSIVKLRLLQPIYVGGAAIPANAFIFGLASISGERVNIQLTSATCNGHVYPIALQVYDGGDGLTGLYVPGMITRDVVKQHMSQSMSGMPLGTLDPSLGAQAATAAIETARSLMTRKIAIVKATLKTGHIALLQPSDTH